MPKFASTCCVGEPVDLHRYRPFLSKLSVLTVQAKNAAKEAGGGDDKTKKK
jgi:hypothetical protein